MEYKAPILDGISNVYDATFDISGIGMSSASNSVNFGDISNFNRCNIGGVAYYGYNNNSGLSNCYNYGDIYCTDSGGAMNIGGVVGTVGLNGSITSCYNYGEIKIDNPNSRTVQFHPNVRIGGISGYYGTKSSVGVISSVNYGEIIYNNTEGKTVYSTSVSLYIGGIVGDIGNNNIVSNSMNYADITVMNEDNMNMCVGGIAGRSHLNSSSELQTKNIINYGNISVPDATIKGNANNSQKIHCGGIVGHVRENPVKQYKYGINYGTVRSETQQATNTYVGSLCGYANNNYTFNCFTDLSDPPSEFTYYPLIGGVSGSAVNTSSCVNYTKNEQSIADTTTAVGDSFGTVKQVTLDKNEESGLFSANFPYRSKLMHQITNGNNDDNGLMYQDYNELSPYLQNYMEEKFGEDIKNYGAYVVIKGNRYKDDFVPGEMVDVNNVDEESLPGRHLMPSYSDEYYTTFYDETLINDEINSIYSSMVSPSERSMLTDYNIYAQQVDRSSMAEVYESNFGTIFTYANTDTTYFQDFSDYQTSIETHPAINENGEVSDTVLYTDINIYIAVDDIDSYTARRTVLDATGKPLKDENGNIVYEYIDTNGYIYITDDLEPLNKKSTIQYYKGDVVQETARLTEKHHYKDHYPEPWLTSDNLNEKLAVDGDWGSSLGYTELNDDHHDGEYWSSGYGSKIEAHQNGNGWLMAVPVQSRDNINNIYTKVIGVETAEDGVHQNIIVAHVIIDYFKPYATLDSVTLKTPLDGNVKSTTDNGLLVESADMPSITDGINGTPKNDVTYYYITDGDLNGQNIQRYNWEQTPTRPQIKINTFNMDENGRLYYDVYWQDRLPADGELYNDLRWNKLSSGKRTRYTTVINPTDIEYDEQQKSTGTATITLNNDDFYYGGYYKVNLYYERTKESDNKKHFATVFIAKQHSPINVACIYGAGAFSSLPGHNGLTGQNDYDSKYGIGEDGYQTGYNVSWYRYYTNNAFGMTYYDRAVNDCRVAPNNGYWAGYGYYYALKGYMSPYKGATYYLDQDNPIYYTSDTDVEVSDTDVTTDTDVTDTDVTTDSDVTTDTEVTDTDTDSEIPKGRAVTLERYVKEVDVYQNEETGAFYPMLFKCVMDVMAENGDIRRYNSEYIQTGKYGINDESNFDNDPNIYQTAATKDGYSLSAEDNGTYKGIVYGNETKNVTFKCTWKSSNVTALAYANTDSKDGYNPNRVRVFYTPINSTSETELTKEQISEYFATFTCNSSNNWTFTLNNFAPVGVYSIVPYMTYTMNLSDNGYNIQLLDSETQELISTSTDNILKWRIPYSQPFVIENRPNDETYLTEYNTSNDMSTPFVLEDSYVAGSENRSVFIRSASANQEIVYNGYEDVMTGDNRVDKFNVYSYVAKTEQNSVLTMAAPYMATVLRWEGEGSPHESLSGNWVSAEVNRTSHDNGFSKYSFDVSYNEKVAGETNQYTYNPSITYYKVLAEDGVTSTIYAVYVVPGVRNKFTSLEIAQESELDEISGSTQHQDEIAELFKESEKLYEEIMEYNGYVHVTIKELNGDKIDLYQTKFFDEKYAEGGTQPEVYNLKSYVYDISVDLPAGYTYEVFLFSVDKDSHTVLKDSQNGFDGKQLILSDSNDQELNIRIVLKRDTSYDVWGVQHIWTFENSNKDSNGRFINEDGGYFYNYVYRRDN